MIRFEPGDATSYLVDFRNLTREEARAIGGYSLENNPVLFSFCSGDGPLTTMHFQGGDHGPVHLDYFDEKMYGYSTKANAWTAAAAYIVFTFLSGRPPLHNSNLVDEVLNSWDDGWAMQLEPMLKDAATT